MIDRERLLADAMRKQRRDAVKLIVVSSVFVVTGAVIAFGPGRPIGLVCLLFFGAGAIVALIQLVRFVRGDWARPPRRGRGRPRR